MARKHKSAAKSSKKSSPRRDASAARISGQFEGNISASGALHIAPGARCKANIRASNVSVEGRFEGRMAASRSMHFGNNADCKGTFDAGSMRVDGNVQGQVCVHNRMDLSPTAEFQGEIVANRLVVADGASFAGRCTIGKFVAKPAARKAA